MKLDRVLALNNAHEVETSRLTAERLASLWSMAFWAEAIGEGSACDAFLIALDQGADYDSPNFRWHQNRYPRFVYVDRIVTAPAARGRGLARALYKGLFAKAREAGHVRVCCEVNLDPPNPGSDRFHATMGFAEVGRATLPGKTVRYFVRDL